MPAATTQPTRPATKRPTQLTLDKAAALCDLTPAQLTGLLNRRANLIANSMPGKYTANPRLTSGDGEPWRCARDVFVLWAVRMGLAKYHGRHLIGYPGIAVMFDWEEQSVRAHTVNSTTFPNRVQPPAEVVVFDRAAVLEYAIQSGILFPDGTPNALKPHRGAPIRNR